MLQELLSCQPPMHSDFSNDNFNGYSGFRNFNQNSWGPRNLPVCSHFIKCKHFRERESKVYQSAVLISMKKFETDFIEKFGISIKNLLTKIFQFLQWYPRCIKTGLSLFLKICIIEYSDFRLGCTYIFWSSLKR